MPSLNCSYRARCADEFATEALCNAENSSGSCTYGAQPASPPSITIHALGDSCSPQAVESSAGGCAAPLEGIPLTPDGLAAAKLLGQVVESMFFDKVRAMPGIFADKPACRLAHHAYICLGTVGPFRCVGGAQALVPPCAAACAAYFAACYPPTARSTVELLCDRDLSKFQVQPTASCANLTAVSTETSSALAATLPLATPPASRAARAHLGDPAAAAAAATIAAVAAAVAAACAASA